jgi:hypothetical protein
MSLFYCHECDNLCDADDGCEEAPNGVDLICIDCVIAGEEDDPSPGSDEAVAKGCTCPVSDNARGQGLPGGNFWISEGCPLHAPAPDHSENEGNVT